MKKLLATLLTVTTFCVVGGASNPPDQGSGTDFSLINYLETHEIDSYKEFIDVIKEVSPESVDPEEDVGSVTSFVIDIDYEDEIVSVTTMGEASYDRSHGASNSASKSYYTNDGIKKFTITIEGTFSYITGTSCNTVSCNGSFTKPIYSVWTSTPTITSGNINTKKAYARIYGIASNGLNSTSYSLTLTCDDSGNFSSY